ncbi:MAG: NADH-quinone oxidoreductase subunit M [Tetrasphaera sp.]|nr:NADH-quinone oxidoreductase subunit M [Tetrasphaera sp.]
MGEMSESRRQRRSESLDPDGRGAANAVLVTSPILTLIGGLALALDLFDLHGLSWVWTLITVLLIGVGAGLAFALGRAGDLACVSPVGERPPLRWRLRRRHGIPGLAKPVVHLARIVAFVDTEVIDELRAGRGRHRPTRWGGDRARTGQSGCAPVGGSWCWGSWRCWPWGCSRGADLHAPGPTARGVGLIGAGRIVPTPVAHNVAGIAALIAFGLAIGVAIERPSVDRAWLPRTRRPQQVSRSTASDPARAAHGTGSVLVVAHARGEVPDGGSAATFLGCLLLVVGGALATFTARDAILFLAFELVLIPMWVLITRFGDPHRPPARAEAGWRFVLYTAVGSTLMLVGILLLVASAHSSDLGRLLEVAPSPAARTSAHDRAAPHGRARRQGAPLPLHTWLPSAHTIAPTAGSVLLAAVLLKMGTYGLVRFPVALVPEGFGIIAPAVAIAAAISILWGGLICLVERDLKRLIAYSSVAHMGFVVLGLATGSEVGLQAALYGNLAHGVISALLFVVVGGLKRRWGSVDLGRAWPALREVAPHRGFLLILGLAAALGLPGLAGFWGEFLVIMSAWAPRRPGLEDLFHVCAVLAAIGGLLAAAYSLRVARLIWVGDEPDHPRPGQSSEENTPLAPDSTPHVLLTRPSGDAPVDVETRGVERVVLLVLALGVIGLGLLPWLAIDIARPAVQLVLGGAP